MLPPQYLFMDIPLDPLAGDKNFDKTAYFLKRSVGTYFKTQFPFLQDFRVEMFYLNTIKQLFLFVEQLDQLDVCLPYSRLLTGIPILAVLQNLRWNSNKTSLGAENRFHCIMFMFRRKKGENFDFFQKIFLGKLLCCQALCIYHSICLYL